MKILSILFDKKTANGRTTKRKTIEEYQRELLVKQGREQFKKLAEKGLAIPVGLL